MTRLFGMAIMYTLGTLIGCGESANEDADSPSTETEGTDPENTDTNILLIDDCDDGNAENEVQGIWLTYSDSHDPAEGESTVSPQSWFEGGEFRMTAPGVGDVGYAAHFSGVTASKLGWDYVGMMLGLGPNSFCPNPEPAKIDVASYTGLRFMVKGHADGGKVTVKLLHSKEGEEGNCTDNGLTGDTLTNWVDYSADITALIGDVWSEVSLSFRKDFTGPENVDIETVLAHAKDLHFNFQSAAGGEVDLWVDNLMLYRAEEEFDTDDGLDRTGDPETIIDPSESGNEAESLFTRTEAVEIRLQLPKEEWETLLGNAQDEEYTPADVTIQGDFIGNVGLRFKGSYGSLYGCFDSENNLICDKLSMKIKFNEYEEEQRYLGLKRINLHSLHHDDTKMRDCLAYDLFRDADIVSPRCSWAKVYVNDELLGLYGLVEQIDGRFTDSRFSMGDGNLYKELWPDRNNTLYFSEHLKTNEDVQDHAAFSAFAKEMIAANDDTLPDILAQWMDMDYVQRYMAADFALANWDGITTFYCGATWPCVNHNFFIYQEQERPFFWLLPWDLEATFVSTHWLGDIEPWDKLDAVCEDIPFVEGEDHYIRPAGCDQTFRAVVLSDRAPYFSTLKTLRYGFMEEENMLKKINEFAQLLEPYIKEDPDIEVDVWLESLEWQIAELDNLRTRITAVLP